MAADSVHRARRGSHSDRASGDHLHQRMERRNFHRFEHEKAPRPQRRQQRRRGVPHGREGRILLRQAFKTRRREERFRTQGRHKSFSTVDLNYVGMDIDKDVTGLMNKITCLAAPFAPLDGINDAGVACGIYMSYQGEETVATNQCDPDKPDITSTTMLRMILDYADDVDEAVELVRSYNLHDSANTSFHYMVADATGKSAILEWVPENGTDRTDNDGTARKLVVHYNTGDEYLGEREANADFQWITNFILRPDYYEDGDEKAGDDRYDRIYERLNATNGVVENETAAMDILKEIGRRTWNGGGGVTVHSAVYNLTKKSVLWVANENYGDKTAAYEYSLATGELKQVG